MLEIFWLFIILSSLQPVIRQRWLEAQRLRSLRAFEQRRKTRVISLIHRQETLSFLGFPLTRYIDIEDSERLLRAIQLTGPEVGIDLILHTPGGLVVAAEQIARALRRHPAKITVFVPHYAMSGGTLIALAADEVVMTENSVLGPVDPQLGQSPAASILKVLEDKPIAEVDDQTIILADMSRTALRQVSATVQQLVSERTGKPEAAKLAETLATGTWTHDYPITAETARELGLPVSTEMPAEILELMQLYPQTTQRRPSVEYIPMPYRSPDSGQGSQPPGSS